MGEDTELLARGLKKQTLAPTCCNLAPARAQAALQCLAGGKLIPVWFEEAPAGDATQ